MARASGDGSSIAVVGISCRLPRAPDPEAYWRLLESGRDAIAELPDERRTLAGEIADEALEEHPGLRLGGFIADVDRFDPAFFGISPREAAAMDPQQRLTLELAWEALEDAGIPPRGERSGAAGVFLGAIAGDYATLVERGGSDAISRHTATGLHRSIIANRVSYALGLEGPSLTVDAAQSASLVAVHLACESIRRGESGLALAGGVHLNLDPRGALGAARIGALSPDGRCFTFDARANGFVRGEGGGIVVLRPLAEARAAGDHVYCVIRGSAVNNDGGGSALTAPRQGAQEEVLRSAYRRAGVRRADVQYVELHGSGTPAGDPVEAAALGAVLGSDRRAAPLPVGSAKTNVGHLEGAAGIAGLIKVALSFERERIPASLNFEQANPAIPLDELGLRVQTELAPWSRTRSPRLAGVSSFGVGGTNCHLVLSDEFADNQNKRSKPKKASGPEDAAAGPPLPGTTPLLLSAASPAALRAQAGRLSAHLEAHPEQTLQDVALSLASTRSQLRHRAVLVAADRARAQAALTELAGGHDASLLTGMARSDGSPVFLFPGQGSQWVGMGVELAATSAVFDGYLEECEAALEPHIDFSVREALAGAGGRASLDRVDVIQPALFAVLVSLARFWRHCGVTPAAVVGHSQGEVAAAYIAGGLSLEDAARIAAVRSRLIQERAGEGGMASVALPVAALDELLAPFGDRLAVAARNGPAAAIVSGERAALDELLEACAAREVRARDLPGGIFASHSPFVEPMREQLVDALAELSPRSGDIPFHSTVTGGLLDTRELGPEYWYRNLRQPVRFEAVTRQLLERGERLFVEISAHPVFATAVEGTVEAVLDDPAEATVLATLRRDEGGPERFARSLAEAHVAGAAVDWSGYFAGGKRVTLPTYPFQRQRYWLDGVQGEAAAEGSTDDASGLATDLADLPESERERRVLALVQGEAAEVLGRASPDSVEPGLSFKELGFDSATAADLRKRLRTATGLRIGSTAVFDHPTAGSLARHLLALATGGRERPAAVRVESSEEPIAIVGMACRFPGASSPRELWQLLAEGVDATAEFPDDRGWDRERLYDPDPDRPDSTYVWRGGFLSEAGHFDAEFFGVSPREALAMDPQQRLLLEASWEACEAAGIDPAGLRGGPIGVFTGISSQDYTAGLRGSGDSVEGYRLTGSAASVASGRVAYTLGLEGPAITVDTACSSSLVATHLAAGALRGGECDLAFAGGGTVLGSPGVFTEFSRQRGLAPDGRCKSFAEGADGTAWSEGAGVLVLERLSDAEANGHRVLATIRGSAVNQDGASNGLTAPNGPSQERVILQALASAGLEPADVDMVEGHGTGTALGDPIEANALLATYGQDREEPIRLGSLKSNIGHAQAAAGVGGVIKAVMAMREGVMPKTLHVDAPSSKIEWEAGRVELLSEAMPWPQAERPRRAAVSSFGISGTNAHLILEEAPVAGRDPGAGASAKDRDGEAPAGPMPFLLSARGEEALAAQAERLVTHLEENPELALTDLAFSLATSRAQLRSRAVLLATEREELQTRLAALAKGDRPVGAVLATAKPAARLAYLFTGQGSQRPGMGRELHRAYPAYRDAFEAACAEIDPLIERSLAELVFSEPGSAEAELLDHTTYAQPALFATEVALYRLLESFGLLPDLLAGHSVGEIAAAHLAGVFSLPDAAKLVCARGALMGALPEGGAMLAIEATEEEALQLIAGKERELSLAAVNSPSSCVISGDEEAIAAAEAACKGEGKKAKRLEVSHAFHSPLMEPMLEQFAAVAKGLAYAEPRVRVVSCLSGEPLSVDQATDPAYWVAHVRQPVRFAEAVGALDAQGATAYLELGPDPVLSAMAHECLGEEEVTLAATLRGGRDEPESLIGGLAQVHAAGIRLDWKAFFAGSGAKAVPLPTYAFQRRRFWLASPSGSSDPTALGQGALDHPFLSAAIDDPEGDAVSYSGRVSLAEHPWLGDHAVLGTVVFPATGFLELALAAGAEVGSQTVEELALEAPLVLTDTAVALRVSVSAPDEEQGRRSITIHSRTEGEQGGWTRNASGSLVAASADAADRLPQWPPAGAEGVDVEDLRARLAEAGFEYGPAFEGLTAAWRDGTELYAEAALPPELAEGAGRFWLHPALLDAAGQAGVGFGLADGDAGALMLPFSWAGVQVSAAGRSQLRVRVRADGEESAHFDLFGEGGEALGLIEALVTRPLDPNQMGGGAEPPLLELAWERAPSPATPSAEQVETWRAPTDSAHEATLATLRKLQSWLADEANDSSRLAILTEGALVTNAEESPDPAQAALAGLVRSAASEHPGRFLLIDTDGSDASQAALEQALLLDPTESQVALRDGESRVARLVKAKEQGDAREIDPERTVLITGATGGLGSLIAEHLVEAHGARHLLLVSRSGEAAEGAAELRARLEEQGATAQIAACDVSDRGELERLLGGIPAERPLGAVIHCAGVLDDATIESVDVEQVERVFAPKAEAAWHLHELTEDSDLTHFVCFSSIAGLIGSPGQGAYAAANAFLDALAQRRRAEGLPASSIAWGLWAGESGMAAGLDQADVARMGRMGIAGLSDDQAFALFDRALGNARAVSAAVRFERAALRAQARAGALPALLARVTPAGKASASPGAFTRRLREAPEGIRSRLAEDFVRAEVASVLGHASAEAVGPDEAFKDLGFDSLAAVELRNRLSTAFGRRLAASIVFDYPTITALSAYLLAQAQLAAAGVEAKRSSASVRPSQAAARLAEATDEELLEFIDTQVGQGDD
jgi:acyl transferase domain-containing protein